MIPRPGDRAPEGAPRPEPPRRLSGDKPTYPAPHRPANPHAPPESRRDPSKT